MNSSYYLSASALQILIFSQYEKKVILPEMVILDNLSENELIYAMNELVESGAIRMNANSETFDIIDDFIPVLSAIVNANVIFKTLNKETNRISYVYVSDDIATTLISVANRPFSYKVVCCKSFQNILPLLDLPDTNLLLDGLSDGLDFLDKNSMKDGNSVEIAKKINIEIPMQDAAEIEEISAITDACSTETGECLVRLAVCGECGNESTIISLTGEGDYQIDFYSSDNVHIIIKSLLEAFK